jgi:Mrp family chromosome partitioning ATPase
VVPLGAADERTSDLLSSDQFAELLTCLQVRFDHVLVDTAPTSTDATALALSSRYDGTLAVVELNTSVKSQLRRGVDGFDDSGSGLIGVVATRPEDEGAPRRRWIRTSARSAGTRATA